eukprot:sb/3468820/
MYITTKAKDVRRTLIHEATRFYKDNINQLYSKNQNEKTDTWKADIQTKTSLQSGLESALNQPICTNDVERAIKDLKRGKSPGIDGIPNELLKEACPNTIKLLTHLYNQCLEHGVYPWNTTVITPIHKKGPKHDPNNYRAIAVGSSLGRVFSTIYLERLVNFRKAHCPDPPNQQGFVKENSSSARWFRVQFSKQPYLCANSSVFLSKQPSNSSSVQCDCFPPYTQPITRPLDTPSPLAPDPIISLLNP